MNPWHDVDPGDDIETLFYSIIEIPKGSKHKYEMDKKTGMLLADRVLYSSVVYPANYGFIPQSFCDDGDPLDVLVLCQEPIVPMCIVPCRPIGILTMKDEKGQDDKIISVHAHDPAYSGYQDISNLPKHILKELQRFFQDYKALENKEVAVDQMRGYIEALASIRQSFQMYKDCREQIREAYGH
jgi:inorganic pyrophosphatase